MIPLECLLEEDFDKETDFCGWKWNQGLLFGRSHFDPFVSWMKKIFDKETILIRIAF